MPLIKPRTRGKEFVRQLTRLDRENHEAVYAYAQFIGESVDYVLNQLVERLLAKDKDFVAWRAEHPESFVPAPHPQPKRRRRTPASGVRAVPGHGQEPASPPAVR